MLDIATAYPNDCRGLLGVEAGVDNLCADPVVNRICQQSCRHGFHRRGDERRLQSFIGDALLHKLLHSKEVAPHAARRLAVTGLVLYSTWNPVSEIHRRSALCAKLSDAQAYVHPFLAEVIDRANFTILSSNSNYLCICAVPNTHHSAGLRGRRVRLERHMRSGTRFFVQPIASQNFKKM